MVNELNKNLYRNLTLCQAEFLIQYFFYNKLQNHDQIYFRPKRTGVDPMGNQGFYKMFIIMNFFEGWKPAQRA
jgi:hypothetical protein